MRYQVSEEIIVDTTLSVRQWEGVGGTLYLSSKDSFYVVATNKMDGTTARLVTEAQAVRWLLLNDLVVPEEYQELAEGIIE